MLMTTRVLNLCNAAKTMARDEFEKGLVLRRSMRMDSVANRLVRRIESDYVPGIFGPYLKDENGKCAGCGEWTAGLKRAVCEAFEDEVAVLLVAKPAVNGPENPDKPVMYGRAYCYLWTAENLNDWAVKRVAERKLSA